MEIPPFPAASGSSGALRGSKGLLGIWSRA